MNDPTANAVRRGAATLQRYVVSLYLLGVVAQFFLVGRGIFGMKPGDTIGKAHSLDAHRELGWYLTEFGGAALLLVTLVAWRKPLRGRTLPYLVVCLVGFPLQPILAAVGEHHRAVGMFHPVNALVLLGLSATLTRRAWAERAQRVRLAAPVLQGEPS
jgi:hypothetical protein